MDTSIDLSKIKDLIDKSQSILVATHEHPTFDSIGSTLAMYLGLVSLGKKVTVVCPDAMTVAHSSFVGVNKVGSELGSKKNFVISLDYVDGSIEKVSYNIEGDKFNLVIEPRPGFASFSEDKVHYSYAGGDADCIITVDTIHLGGLKKLYEGDKELFASKPLVNVDRHPNNAQYGQYNMVDAQSSSTAEVVGRLLGALGVRLTVDIATNLLNALYGATNNFQTVNISAGAFELAGACVKAGGKRFSPTQPSEEVATKSESVGHTQPVAEEAKTMQEDGAHSHTHAAEDMSHMHIPTPASAVPSIVHHPPAHQSFPSAAGQIGQALPSSGQAPDDWLKPKIFKSSNLL